MALPDFWRLETRFWKADEAFYAANLTEDALMAFPEPVGVLNRAATVAAISNSPRWVTVAFYDQRLIQPHPGTTILSYTAEAERGSPGSRYRALAASVYVQVQGSWQLAFHQQTPLESPGA